MDSVNETFQGSQVQLAAPKGYLFMHWTPWGRSWNGRGEFEPACERIRVTGVVTVVCQASPANHQLKFYWTKSRMLRQPQQASRVLSALHYTCVLAVSTSRRTERKPPA